MYFKAHSEFPELSSMDNIKVCVRLRPMNNKEMEENCREAIEVNMNQIIINKDQKNQKQFSFDRVFDASLTQEDIFTRVGQSMVESFLKGFNSTIFAYGQTGAGKTHTMIGCLESPGRFGLLPRCLEYIFYTLNDCNKEYSLKMSFIEIYNEKIIDLLSDNDLGVVMIREDGKRGVYLEGVKEDQVVDFNSAVGILKKGITSRHTSSTNMNKESSRSHSILTIHCQILSTENDCSSVKNSVFNFIDLAGSERHKDTRATGERFKEGCNINKSLTVLGSVINALSDKKMKQQIHKSFIRYRDSKLTHLLKNSLGGNSKTVFIANVSPACKYANENLSTLMFAQRAKKVQNAARMNEQIKANSIVVLTVELNRTKQELHLLEEKYVILEKAQLLTRDELVCGKCMNRGVELKQKLIKRSKLLSQVFEILKLTIHKFENELNLGSKSLGALFSKTENRFDRTGICNQFKSMHEIRDWKKTGQSCESVSINISKRKKTRGGFEESLNSISKMRSKRNKSGKKDFCVTSNKKTNNKMGSHFFLTNQKSPFKNQEIQALLQNNLQFGKNTYKNNKNNQIGFLAEISRQIKIILTLLKIEIMGSEKVGNMLGETCSESHLFEIKRLQTEVEFYKLNSEETERQVNLCEQEILNLVHTVLKLKEQVGPVDKLDLGEKPEFGKEVLSNEKLSSRNRANSVSDSHSNEQIKTIGDLQKNLRFANNEIEKLKNEQIVLFERNKMLKNWNEQALEFKEKTSDELERLKYEKFAMMKKYDEDFDQIREKQERLFGHWKTAEGEKETLVNNSQSQSLLLKMTQDQNGKLLREIDHHVAVKSLNDNQISELTEKLNGVLLENKKIKNDNFCLREKLLEIENRIIFEKDGFEKIVKEQRETIDNLVVRNQDLKLFGDKMTESSEETRSKLQSAETDLQKTEVSFEILFNSHNKMFERFKKTKQIKDSFFTRNINLNEQANFFFQMLLDIRDKMDGKSSSIFEDFIVVSQIKNENCTLKTKLVIRENELTKIKAEFEKLISENDKNLIGVKSNFKFLENKFLQLEKGLKIKNEELWSYRKEIEGIREQNFKIIKRENEGLFSETLLNLENTDLQVLRTDNLILKEKLKWLASCTKQNKENGDGYVIVKTKGDKIEKQVVAKRIKFI